MKKLVAKADEDKLYARIPHGDGPTLLREALLVLLPEVIVLQPRALTSAKRDATTQGGQGERRLAIAIECGAEERKKRRTLGNRQ